MSLPLAAYFKNVLALDPDNGMLTQARQKSKKLKIRNIIWQKGSSKTLDKVNGAHRLVSMGQSFHWMDAKIVVEQLYGMVEAGGGMVVVGTDSIKQSELTTRKNEIVKKIVTKYLGPKRRAGKYFYEAPGTQWEHDLYPSSRFSHFEKISYKVYMQPSVDEIIWQLFSMSWASKKLLGNNAINFENDLKQELSALLNNQKLTEQIKFVAHFWYKD